MQLVGYKINNITLAELANSISQDFISNLENDMTEFRDVIEDKFSQTLTNGINSLQTATNYSYFTILSKLEAFQVYFARSRIDFASEANDLSIWRQPVSRSNLS